MNSLIRFREVLEQHYGTMSWLPVANGLIHRFHVPGDKSGSQNGWYVLYLEGIASAAFGSWKEGRTYTWCSRKPVDHREALEVRQRIEQAQRQRQIETLKRQHKAAKGAADLWRYGSPADPSHPYLIAKQVTPHGLRQSGDDLLVPLRNAAGELVNLQRIGADGDKRFLFGGQVQGAFHLLGRIDPGQTFHICEGWATGATLIEQYCNVSGVACAMNAGNLKPVALALRETLGDEQALLIAGDDDRLTEGNPGWKAANAAALAVGGLVSFPAWPADAPDHLSDFNDLHHWRAGHVRV